MMRYVAFLRAINVGGRRLKMDDLRDLFAGMGFGGVETFIAGGNVIFNAAEPDAAALDYQVDTFIRAPAELAAIAAKWPFSEADREPPYSFHVAFLPAPPDDEARERLMTFTTPVDAFHVDGREAYRLRRDAVGESSFAGSALERALGMPATARNMRTVEKIATKYADR